MKLLLPPDKEPIPTEAQVIFLAGPIQGAPAWQAEAIELIRDEAPEIWIASPRRAYLDGTFDYYAQVGWEVDHIRRALKQGTVLFWLAAESEHHPERAYAQTTRFELAECKTRHEYEGGNVVIGIEDGFSGARYIRERVGADCPGIPILDDFGEAVRRAIELARS